MESASSIKIILFLAFSLSNIIAQAADSFPTGRCTDLSLRSPSWHISDLKLGSSDFSRSLSFLLESVVTGYTTRCSNLGDETICETIGLDRDDISTLFYWWIEADNLVKVHLEQTWNCSDVTPHRSIAFKAAANITISRDCGVHVSSSDLNVIHVCQSSGAGSKAGIVFGSLLSPVRIDFSSSSPPSPTEPPGRDTPGCLAASPQNSWVISDFYFSASYIGIVTFGSIPSYSGNLGFNLTNTANRHTVACSIVDYELGYFLVNGTEGDKWIGCVATPNDPSRERPEYKIVTRVRFNQLSEKLSVHQVWFCDSSKDQVEGDSSGVVGGVAMFEGVGTTDVPLHCTRSGSPREARMSMTCTAPEFTVTSSSNNTSRTDLPVNALSRPRLDLPSCTVSAFYLAGWTLHDFQYRLDSAVYTNQPADYKTSYWGFEIKVNQSTESINYSCSGWRVLKSTDDNACYPWPWRTRPEDGYINGINVTYRFDVETYRIMMNTVWVCSDLDLRPYVLLSLSLSLSLSPSPLLPPKYLSSSKSRIIKNHEYSRDKKQNHIQRHRNRHPAHELHEPPRVCRKRNR